MNTINNDPDIRKMAVMGTIRSGKTLIGRALNMHPGMSVQQEPFFFFMKMCRTIYHRDILKDDFDAEQPIETDFCKANNGKKGFRQAFPELFFGPSDIAELIRLTIWQQETAGNDRAPNIIPFLTQVKEGTANEVLANLMKLLERAYPKEGLQVVGFTEGWCDDFIAPLMNLPVIPFKCIHAIRDPRAVIASRNAGKNLEKYGGKYPLLFLVRHWRKSIAYSIINRHNPNYLAVRYEDLIRSPEEWFRKICSHLEVSFSENMMHPEKFVDGNCQLWKKNTNFEEGDGFYASSLEKWKDVLSEKEIGFIEYLCEPEMSYFHYEPVCQDFGLRHLTSFEEDETQVVKWLRPYRLGLSEKELMLEMVRKYLLSNEMETTEDIYDYFFIYAQVHEVLSKYDKRFGGS